ncbi:MAG TPA: DUF1577 domain-containing protein [Spirochaetota bacterium]|nr:DUF1577 domain-containing protein [Spirochaetota bacterium]
MAEFKERKLRAFDDIRTLPDIIEMLKTQFHNRKLNIKYSIDRMEAKVNEYLEDNTVMLVTDQEFTPEDSITIYGLLDKYFEIDLKVVETRGPGYFRCSIVSMRKASRGRRDLRFRVGPEKVTATNFKISKHTIDITSFTIPTGIKVIIEQFQSQHSKLADIFKVDVFQPGDPIIDRVKRSQKNVFIEDFSNPESLKPENDNFVDMEEFLGDDAEQYLKKGIERGYKSLIISPVTYITPAEQPIPFAYIQAISKKDILTIEKMLEIKELGFTLMDRIRDANTLLVPVHQQIVDISLGGAKLMLSDENLKKYVIHSKGFVFDIVFKLQAPITIYGEVKFTFSDKAGNLFVGVDFAGNSSRKDEMKRFYSVIKPMEIEYKNRLIKEMKQKNK